MTTRRNFLNGLIVAGAGFMILPGAGRVWTSRRLGDVVVVRFPVNLSWYESSFMSPQDLADVPRTFLVARGSTAAQCFMSRGLRLREFEKVRCSSNELEGVLRARGLRAVSVCDGFWTR